MSKGRIFNENNLDKLELELQQLYYSLGKYAARIEANWRRLDEDRVAIDIVISEGISAKIKSINITGNYSFDEDDLLDLFDLESTDSAWFPSDEYSSSRLKADLESLKSHYLDRGYIQFSVSSQQVSISPDRKDISITINISEGDQYLIKSIELTGEMVVDVVELRALISFREGDVFSLKQVNRAILSMKNRLGEDGYAYADIRVLTDLDDENNSLDLGLLVVPGKKMRVRYINFSGNEQTEDAVLRREMRQFEGELYQRSKVDRSRIRLQRLNYLATVNVELQRVEGSEDLVDIEIGVTERFSGNLQLGLGFSDSQGIVLNVGFAHENIFGSGKAIDITFDNSKASSRYRFSYENPYYTTDGISRGFSLTVAETDSALNNTSDYLLDRIAVAMNYGIPLSEFNSLRLELGLMQNDLQSTPGSSDEVFDFIVDNSDVYDESTPRDELVDDTYQTVFTSIGFAKDTRNRRIFASSGSLNSINLELQTGDLDFYKLIHRHRSAFAMTEALTLSFRTRVGYGDSYSTTTDLPPYEKFTAGGVRSVRGYERNSLGPLDSNGDPYGGNLQVIGSAEILIPISAIASSETFRLGVYFDAGNVFANVDTFEAEELRQSVGLSAKWFSVIGPIEASYSETLNDQPGDDIQNFQFALGASF
jgi:outer membrane protein insertion porin family